MPRRRALRLKADGVPIFRKHEDESNGPAKPASSSSVQGMKSNAENQHPRGRTNPIALLRAQADHGLPWGQAGWLDRKDSYSVPHTLFARLFALNPRVPPFSISSDGIPVLSGRKRG